MSNCPKCNHPSGDDWRQCHGVCPMEDSPHFNPRWKPDADLEAVELMLGVRGQMQSVTRALHRASAHWRHVADMYAAAGAGGPANGAAYLADMLRNMAEELESHECSKLSDYCRVAMSLGRY